MPGTPFPILLVDSSKIVTDIAYIAANGSCCRLTIQLIKDSSFDDKFDNPEKQLSSYMCHLQALLYSDSLGSVIEVDFRTFDIVDFGGYLDLTSFSTWGK